MGHSINEFVVYSRADNRQDVVTVKGRWFYCKKCKRAEQLSGIFLPERSRDNTFFATVLAIGDRCGNDQRKNLSRTELLTKMELPDWRPQCNLGVDVLDKVLCPEDHQWGIWRSPYSPDDYFIHECVAEANFGKPEETEDARTDNRTTGAIIAIN